MSHTVVVIVVDRSVPAQEKLELHSLDADKRTCSFCRQRINRLLNTFLEYPAVLRCG